MILVVADLQPILGPGELFCTYSLHEVQIKRVVCLIIGKCGVGYLQYIDLEVNLFYSLKLKVKVHIHCLIWCTSRAQ